MIWWTGLAPVEFEFPSPCSLSSTILVLTLRAPPSSGQSDVEKTFEKVKETRNISQSEDEKINVTPSLWENIGGPTVSLSVETNAGGMDLHQGKDTASLWTLP